MDIYEVCISKMFEPAVNEYSVNCVNSKIQGQVYLLSTIIGSVLGQKLALALFKVDIIRSNP